MNRRKLAVGIGLGALGAVAGSAIRSLKRQRATADERRSGDRTRGVPATFTGDTGQQHRSSTSMVPGVPVGSGTGIDNALRQPDTDLGGGVAGDTTVGLKGEQLRDGSSVRNDDKERNTL